MKGKIICSSAESPADFLQKKNDDHSDRFLAMKVDVTSDPELDNSYSVKQR